MRMEGQDSLKIHILCEIVNGHVLELIMLCTIDISGVSKDALDAHAGTQTYGSLFAKVNSIPIARRKKKLTRLSRETLIFLRVVVLQTDLELSRQNYAFSLRLPRPATPMALNTLDTES